MVSMRKARIQGGLSLFALAGVVGGLAWIVDALLNSLMLWVVAAFLAWKGTLVFLGRGESSPVSPPPAPGASQEVPDALASSSTAPGDSPRTDHPDELGEFVKEFKVFGDQSTVKAGTEIQVRTEREEVTLSISSAVLMTLEFIS